MNGHLSQLGQLMPKNMVFSMVFIIYLIWLIYTNVLFAHDPLHCHSQAPVHEGSQQLSALCLWRLGEPLRHWIVRGMKEGFASPLFSVLTVFFDFDLMLCLHF